MSSRQRLFPLAVMCLVFFLAGCGADSADTHADDHMGDTDHSHSSMTHIHAEIPADYANLTNPLAGQTETVTAGKTIFEANCLVCHGAEGHGDGPAAVGLSPAPADLSDSAMMHDLSDAYLFWRISEGGAMPPFNSAMPTWKAVLTEEQRWQVVNYVRSLGH